MIFQGFSRITSVGQVVAMALFTIAGLISLIFTTLSVAGILPWLELPVSLAGTQVAWAGPAFQVGLTVLLLLLAVYVPSIRHVLMLEAAHRDFAVSMDDITSAYKAVHFADRKEGFEMQREFDSIRERFEFLRTHPDLPEINAELLTIAAQMSHQSRDLAKSFCDEKVTRAQESLLHRKKEAHELEELIQTANAVSRDLRRQIEDVEFAESSARSQFMRLREDLSEIEARILGRGPAAGRHLRPVGDAVS